MPPFTSYGTFIVANRREARLIERADIKRSWRITTRDDPTFRHWCDANGRESVQYAHPTAHHASMFPADRPSKEVIIATASPETASNLVSLIHGGILLGYPDTHKSPDPGEPYSLENMPSDVYVLDKFARLFEWYQGVHYGCFAAMCAWGKPDLIYSIQKYKLSLGLDSITPHSASPRYGQVFRNERNDPAFHTSAAFAINLAFAAIEEMGLEVRSSKENPRFNRTGKPLWNPKVRADIEGRLARVGIDGNERFQWVFRGKSTEIERETKPKLGRRAQDAKRYPVRDRELTLIDAIHYVSYLRNFIGAHKFPEAVKSITPYDVHNAQLVARRLLLGRLELWGKLLDI